MSIAQPTQSTAAATASAEALPENPEFRELNKSDRCDAPKCGAQAYGVAQFIKVNGSGDTSTSELTFCGHHLKAYRGRLDTLGAEIIDQTHLIRK